MARPSKGPRLWLRPERRDSLGRLTHAATWLILDGIKQVGTGFSPEQRIDAEASLLAYREEIEKSREVSEEFPDLYLYFITAAFDSFPVKIGISETPRLRMSQLQSGLPYELQVLAVVRIPDTLFERRLHRRFAAIKLRGEWFKREPELIEYIQCLANACQNIPVNK